MGNLPGRPRTRSTHPFRGAHGNAGMAAGTRRISRRAAAPARRPGRHRAGLGGAAAAPRIHRAEPVRPPQPVSGECRGGPASLGDGLSAPCVLRTRGARAGRGAVDAPLRERGRAAHPRRVQRADARLAGLLHVHVFHRPRREIPAWDARRKWFRPTLANLPFHAARGGAPHDGRDHRHRPRGSAYRRPDARARHRRHQALRGHPARYRAAISELSLQRVPRSLRRRTLHQRRQLLHRRAQGALAGRASSRRPPAHRAHRRRRRGRGRAHRARRYPCAHRAEPGPSIRVLHRLQQRRPALEPHPRRGGRRPGRWPCPITDSTVVWVRLPVIG